MTAPPRNTPGGTAEHRQDTHCGPECPYPFATSLDDEWAGRDLPAAAAWCYQLRLHGGNWLTGAVTEGRARPCEGWGHRECAEAKAHRQLTHLVRQAERYDKLWVVRADYDKQLMHRMAQRRSRAGVEGYFWVRREDGAVWFVVDRPLSGRLAPEVMVARTSDEAVQMTATDGLRLPGVVAVRFGGSWSSRGGNREQSGNWVSFGVLSDARWQQAVVTAIGEARRRWKVKITDVSDPLPKAVPVDEWFELLGDAIRETPSDQAL